MIRKMILCLMATLCEIALGQTNVQWNNVNKFTTVNTNLVGAMVGGGLVLTNGVLATTGGGGTAEEHDPVWEAEKSGYLPLTGGSLSGGLTGPGWSLSGGYLYLSSASIFPSLEPGPPMIYSYDNSYMLYHNDDTPKWYYGSSSSDDREIAVKGDLADKASTVYVDVRDLDGTYPVTNITSAIVNHRRNVVTVSGVAALTMEAADDFDAVLLLDIQTGGAVNWVGVTNGLSVYQPKGNKALEYEAGKKYLVGITRIGMNAVAISKQELEAL